MREGVKVGPEIVTIRYRNHRGEVADRRIRPEELVMGRREQESPWLLRARDVDQAATCYIAMRDILAWDVGPGSCEHGVVDGNWCPACNAAYREARARAEEDCPRV